MEYISLSEAATRQKVSVEDLLLKCAHRRLQIYFTWAIRFFEQGSNSLIGDIPSIDRLTEGEALQFLHNEDAEVTINRRIPEPGHRDYQKMVAINGVIIHRNLLCVSAKDVEATEGEDNKQGILSSDRGEIGGEQNRPWEKWNPREPLGQIIKHAYNMLYDSGKLSGITRNGQTAHFLDLLKSEWDKAKGNAKENENFEGCPFFLIKDIKTRGQNRGIQTDEWTPTTGKYRNKPRPAQWHNQQSISKMIIKMKELRPITK